MSWHSGEISAEYRDRQEGGPDKEVVDLEEGSSYPTILTTGYIARQVLIPGAFNLLVLTHTLSNKPRVTGQCLHHL